MKQLIILFLLATLSFPGVGQDQQYRAQRADFALYNMGMGRVFPSGIEGYLSLRKQGKMNWSKSLKTGFIYLDIQDVALYDGEASVTTIALGVNDAAYPAYQEYKLTAHEVLHLLQYEGFVYINPLFNKLDTKWKENFTWYNVLSKFVYLDLNGIYGWVAYEWVGGRGNPCYWNNFLEKEAEHYAIKQYLDCL